MTRLQWILLTIAAIPVLIGATLTSALLGPYGAASYALLLLAGINTRHLFRTPTATDLLHRTLNRLSTSKGRHR